MPSLVRIQPCPQSLHMMLGEGLEPTRIIVPPDPKSSASANSATRAKKQPGKPTCKATEPMQIPILHFPVSNSLCKASPQGRASHLVSLFLIHKRIKAKNSAEGSSHFFFFEKNKQLSWTSAIRLSPSQIFASKISRLSGSSSLC